MILNQKELVELTGYKRKDAQVRALRFMGIEHLPRPDGTIAVLRAHAEAVLSGQDPARLTKKIEPNWSAI